MIAFRLSQEKQEQAERCTKRKVSKNQQNVQSTTLSCSGWVLVVTTLPQEHWSDRQILCVYQARWHSELLFKRIKQLLQRQSVRCTTAATAKSTITLLLLGWAGTEEESAAMRLTMKDASIVSGTPTRTSSLLIRPGGKRISAVHLVSWMLAEASFDLFCHQLRGGYTAERFRTCLPHLQRFVYSGHRSRPHLYTQVCHWLGIATTIPQDEERGRVA